MRDEDRAAWWAVWGMARCPICGRLVTIEYALNTPYFSTHPHRPFGPHPMPPCPQGGHFHESIASFGTLPTTSEDAS
jgi:hypothetical protein